MKNNKNLYTKLYTKLLASALCLFTCSIFCMNNMNNKPKWDKEDEKLFLTLSNEINSRYNNDCSICLGSVEFLKK